MREELERKQVHQAVDSTLSGLTGDPWLFRKVSSDAGKGERVMKRKLSAGLVLAIVLALLATAALAAVLLSHQEIMEQVAVPLANENDSEISVNKTYTPEQLAELISVLNENGISLEENNRIMQLIRNGQGYWEEETIMELCRQAFGGNFGTWTLEQQDWFNRLMVKIGYSESYESHLPGPDNMTYEAAESFAFAALRKEYGENVPLEDRTIFRLERSFYYDTEDDLNGATWHFYLEPKDLTHGRYSAVFEDKDPAGTVRLSADVPDWTKPYTGDMLLARMRDAYGWNQGNWPQKAWQAFHEMLQDAEEAPQQRNNAELKAYRLTEYPEPSEGDITREAAIEAAKQAGLDPRAALDSTVLTEYEGKRRWMVSFQIYAPLDSGEPDSSEGLYVVSVTSPEGTAESIRKYGMDDNNAMAYVPEAAYEKAREGLMTASGAIRLAAEAIRAQYPGPDLLDEEKYQVFADGYNQFNVRFSSRDIHYGNASAVVQLDGTVKSIEADTSALTGDTLMNRYWSAYGYYGQWTQERWQQLNRDMQEFEPKETEGRIIRQTVYPSEDQAKISRDQAIALAIKATGQRSAEAHTCILIGAEPHPVWKLRMLTEDYVDPMIELDAETGKVLNTDRYKVDYTPRWHVFTLESAWRKMEFDPENLEALAREEISFAYSNMALDEPDFEQEHPGAWTYSQDGLTARFTARWAGMEDYEVTFDENGYVISMDRRPSASTEHDPATVDDIIPTPRPDGKPWFWGNDFASPEFWSKLDHETESRGVTAANLAEKKAEWDAEYGDETHWPQNCYVINYFLETRVPSDFIDPVYPIFTTDGKKTKEEIMSIASEAFRKVAEPEFGAEWVDQTWCTATLWNDGYNYNAVHETYGRPVWWVEFWTGTGNDRQSCGYAQLDEDGNVLDAQQSMSNG